MSVFVDRIMKATGTVALAVIAILLVAGRGNSGTADPETASTNVTVANPITRPVPSQATDNPALRPYMTSVTIAIDSSSTEGSNSFQVPAGQRLVIQAVSYIQQNYTSGEHLQVDVYVQVGDVFQPFRMPQPPTLTAPFPGAGWTGTLYADPGTSVVVSSGRNVTGTLEHDYVYISGYLVPVG
ncbi:MAG TPA: hypothetical protein VKS60_12870 [Stellaceae bacterium]|nr:hypothetical protein [Stellaceae bacterium]